MQTKSAERGGVPDK